MKKYLHAMKTMMSCEESSRLVSDSIDRELTRGEKLVTWMHQVMCWPCCRFLKQMELLHKACQRRAQGDSVAVTEECSGLSEQAKQRIAEAIGRHTEG